jgi:membrane protein YdbS with pleckstrin-like domain
MINGDASQRPPGRTERAAEWIYSGIWHGLVKWFHVPDEPPTLPAAPGERIESFKPARGFLDYLKLWFWIVCLAIDIGLTIAYIAAAIALIAVDLWWVAAMLFPIYLVIAIVPDVLAYIALHLRYDTTWYVMTDRSLRIRRGIWVIHERTITFENVQNMKVTRGPVQRYFGIANLMVETAGSGGGGEKGQANMSTSNRGIIEGIADAERLRDMILPRLRRTRSVGLGDEEDERAEGAGFTDRHVAVLREIRSEITALAG